MAKIVIDQSKIKDIEKTLELCPFGAIENNDGKIEISAACKMCKICVQQGDEGAFQFIEDEVVAIDKDQWKGIAVYVDHLEGEIHPVTLELIGKAKELAGQLDYPVYAIYMGHNIEESAKDLLHYGVDEVFVYDDVELRHFRIEPYAAVFEDFIDKNKPSIILVGATTVGRSLAPRVAARFQTGLTADCTVLEVKDNTDLVQIRPAFGGNIMARIVTTNHRPQFATVRYKIMAAAEPTEKAIGKITKCDIAKEKLVSKIKVLEVKAKEVEEDISDAEVIVVAGRGVKSEKDLDMIYKLAEKLKAQVATTRPLIEAGWGDPRKQIGLSGRTVRPKLIITCGVSGSVQFIAGMSNSDNIFAINIDENAQIFNVAHYGIVGDIYEIVPRLIEAMEDGATDIEGLKAVL